MHNGTLCAGRVGVGKFAVKVRPCTCGFQLSKHRPQAVPDPQLLLGAVVVDVQLGLQHPLHRSGTMGAVVDRAEGHSATSDTLALLLAVTLHEDEVGCKAEDLVDGAGSIIVYDVLDCAPYSVGQVIATYVQLSTQNEAPLIDFTQVELVRDRTKLGYQLTILQQLFEQLRLF